MRPAGRRRQKESFAPDHRKPPPPTPTAPDPWQFSAAGRDSDVSLCSSRPSTASNNRVAAVPISDRSYQLSAMRTINAFLASHSAPIALKPPYPSAKEIIETLKFVLSAIEFPVSNKLEDDLFTVLKFLNCPIKLNKSALKAPGTPHSWPSLLGVIHWLVQVGIYNEHLLNSSRNEFNFEDDSTFGYAMRSYLSYIGGDDDAVENEDRMVVEKLEKERDLIVENTNGLEQNVQELERKLEGLKNGPSPKEMLETERNVLEEDVKKFYTMIEQLDGHIANVSKTLEEKEKELETKIIERKKISEENVELKSRVEEQAFNARDAERMKRDLQAVERDIAESEAARNTWEEKSWDLDGEIGKKFKELQSLMIECNQAIRKLKLGNGFQYELNAKGSTPAEVLGVDYKSKLKPALASLADETKKSSMLNLEEQISLQKISVEIANKIEAKRNYIASLQSQIDEAEVQLKLLKNEIEDHTSRCAMEARKLAEDVEEGEHYLDVVEKEAAELLRTSQANLQEATSQCEEEVEMCARELFALVESVSKYKEHMTSKIADLKDDYLKTMNEVSEIHKSSLSEKFGKFFDASK